jgi:hypothetical protein
VSGYRGVGRLLERKTVGDRAEEKCRDKNRGGESKHSDGIHGGLPREIIFDSPPIYPPSVESVFLRAAPTFQVKRARQCPRNDVRAASFTCTIFNFVNS